MYQFHHFLRSVSLSSIPFILHSTQISVLPFTLELKCVELILLNKEKGNVTL